MKNSKKMFFYLAMAGMIGFTACSDDDDSSDDDGPVASQTIELSGDLATQTLTADKDYLIRGQAFVRDGQVLTIAPGTVIKGDKATRGTLIIDKGGKIDAVGTATDPIIMTSSQPAGIRDRGDWGGLVILGRANTNQDQPAIEGITPAVTFGSFQSSADDNESSGTLRYVRVEFAGIELTPNNETNSITMGGVGRGTEMEYNMVSFGGDDGFEWFGGTVNGRYFISHAMWDDDFDVDYGWSGNVQYGIAIRYTSFADQSGSNGFETDNGPNDNDVTPYTNGVFSNITVLGPIKTGTSVSNGNFQHSIDLRRRTALRITNSVFAGFPRGVRMNQPSVVDQYQSGNGVLTNNILVATNNSATYQAGSGVDVATVQSIWEATNETIEGPASDATHQMVGIDPDLFFGSRVTNDYPSNPNFAVTSGMMATGASFDNAIFNEPNRAGYFDVVNFRGAFGATNWAAGWAEFDPIDAEY